MRSIERAFDPDSGRSPVSTAAVSLSSTPIPAGFPVAGGHDRRKRRRVPTLTRRGRVFVIALVAGLLLTAFSLGRVSSTASTTASRGDHLRHVVVQPGQSLWTIARAAVPSADPRATVQRIVDLNGLSDVVVQPGQQLALPSG
jgi:LysM repeat protein